MGNIAFVRSEIAADLHFSDRASFCKFFKKWTGMTPGEYPVKNTG
ncbi:MAG: AraC family transcriptional regulator [Bacteroidales bacterium]|nr:AraC family transcriptional regulator [Bacteroidales bacterium]